MSFDPHLLIRASAGSGKTFQLTTRYLGLLARGASPERILATTFTRKAAGEIQGRVLSRLAAAALSEGAAAALGEAMEVPGFDQSRARELLVSTIQRLGRLRIATFDAFFGSLARMYALDLGLPPRAVVVPDDLDGRLRARAVGRMLDALGTEGAVTLLRLLANGRLEQAVGRQLTRLLRFLADLFADSPEGAWKRPVLPGASRLDEARTRPFVEAFDALPREGFTPAVQKAVLRDRGALAARDLAAIADSALLGTVAKDPPTYYGKPLPEPLPDLYAALGAMVTGVVRARLDESTAALWDFLAAFAGHYAEVKREVSALRFEDVPRALARGADDASFTLDDLALRLDGRLDHLLFDEFQDTSLPQWQILAPLVDEIRAAGDGSRTLLVVGDRKQAIYGFRGGVAAIFDALDDETRPLAVRELDRSYRSSPVIMEAVNRLFQSLEQNPAVDRHLGPARDFVRDFRPHASAKPALPGFVELRVAPAPADPKPSARGLAALREGCRLVAQMFAGPAERRPRSVGVLLRTNKSVRRVMHELRKRGIEASEEGGNPLADAPVVSAVLALLTLADHPADTVALFHVGTSPLGHLLGLAWDAPRETVGRASRGLRRALLESGYGETLARLAERLLPLVTPHEEERLAALVDIAYAYEPFATLRPRDFVAHVRQKKVEDPRASVVRVMTVHQSKGLEFDAVVLCELETPLVPANRAPVLVERASALAPIARVSRNAPAAERAWVPELAAMAEAEADRELAQSLALLYVAVTRPVSSLHLVVAPIPEKSKAGARTFASLVRHGLAPGRAATAGETLATLGEPCFGP